MPDPTPFISDGQVAAILVALGSAGLGVIAFLKWCVGQWREERAAERVERGDERESREKDRAVLSDMQLEVRSLFVQSQRRDEKRRLTEQPPNRRHTASDDDFAHIPTDVHEIKQEEMRKQQELRGKRPRVATPAGGHRRIATITEDP